MKSLRAVRVAAFATAVALAGCTFNIRTPADQSTVPSPVVTDIEWNASLQSNTLKIVLDPAGAAADVTGQFQVSASAATANLVMAPGNHVLSVSGRLWDGTLQDYASRSATSTFSVFSGPEAVNCYAFDDGYADQVGPSDAVYIPAGGNQACIPGGAAGVCRRWFGRCVTTDTAKPVYFNVFDDGGVRLAGPSDAVYIPAGGNQACVPGGANGVCRRWFGQAFTADGRTVACKAFDDGYASPTGASDAIYIRGPIPSTGSACIPGGPIGVCRRWFGQCSTMIGTPITYTMVLNGSPGWPSGTINGTAFGGGSANIQLTLTFEGNTSNVIPYYVPTTKHAVSDGEGFEITVGTATFKIEDLGAGTVIAQGTFLPAAGIFVSVDNGNRGIGFGAFGAIPPNPAFPAGGVEVAYPYARFLAAPTDLKSNYTSDAFGGLQNGVSCPGFNGSPGTPGPGNCHTPQPLPTTAGPLIINADTFASPQVSARFTAVLH